MLVWSVLLLFLSGKRSAKSSSFNNNNNNNNAVGRPCHDVHIDLAVVFSSHDQNEDPANKFLCLYASEIYNSFILK